jgi:hypothetical protein
MTAHDSIWINFGKSVCIFVLLLLLMSKQIDDTQTVHINAWEEETKVEVLQCEPGEATFLSRGAPARLIQHNSSSDSDINLCFS